ncbi:MAG: zf-HC2 domain-containing protein [Acidobacteria bacterium]|uniref:Zf-HC2 domain-containing protein n=1 Tax=Candidatus Polarisedimenticola svalbardensis TaxID=2886004 RepID=A0A8J6Y1V3_9BACT|nr:zf-HC2 domain-containing protein [Candidatus Polarisedimenticola svalbardensis]
MTHHDHDRRECRSLFEQLSEYMDGELRESACSRFDEHFRDCPRCEQFVEQMRKAVRLVEGMPCPKLPDEVRRALLASAEALDDSANPS